MFVLGYKFKSQQEIVKTVPLGIKTIPFRKSLFTYSALWAELNIESLWLSVCLCVTKVVIVNTGQSIRFHIFLHKIEWAQTVLRTSKLHDHSKVMMILKPFLSMINKGVLIWNLSTVNKVLFEKCTHKC